MNHNLKIKDQQEAKFGFYDSKTHTFYQFHNVNEYYSFLSQIQKRQINKHNFENEDFGDFMHIVQQVLQKNTDHFWHSAQIQMIQEF